MSDYCPRCGRFLMSEKSTCFCNSFQVRIPDYHGEEWQTVWAQSAEGAARKLSQKHYESDCFDPNTFEDVVEVKDHEDFIVSTRVDVVFMATPVSERDY